MGTPRYPRSAADDLRALRAGLSNVQTAGQSRVAYDQASKGLWLPDMAADPPAPPNGVRLYAKLGHLFCREADGSIHQLTT